MDCHPFQTNWCLHLYHPHHFLRRMPFLTQPSQFILAWDRHQICWLAYPVCVLVGKRVENANVTVECMSVTGAQQVCRLWPKNKYHRLFLSRCRRSGLCSRQEDTRLVASSLARPCKATPAFVCEPLSASATRQLTTDVHEIHGILRLAHNADAATRRHDQTVESFVASRRVGSVNWNWALSDWWTWMAYNCAYWKKINTKVNVLTRTLTARPYRQCDLEHIYI